MHPLLDEFIERSWVFREGRVDPYGFRLSAIDVAIGFESESMPLDATAQQKEDVKFAKFIHHIGGVERLGALSGIESNRFFERLSTELAGAQIGRFVKRLKSGVPVMYRSAVWMQMSGALCDQKVLGPVGDALQ